MAKAEATELTVPGPDGERTVRISSPDKVCFPDRGITKLEVARYYLAVSQPLLGVLRDRPTMRVCLLMSDLEQAEHGATGRGREWLARATRAPRDPAWIADGVVWATVSPGGDVPGGSSPSSARPRPGARPGAGAVSASRAS